MDPTLDEFKRQIKDLLKHAGVKTKKIEALVRAWNETQPESINKHTRIAGFSQGCVIVEVDNPALLQELQSFKRDEIFEKLKEELEINITGIRFRAYSGN